MRNFWLGLLGLVLLGLLAYFCFMGKSSTIKERLLHNAQEVYHHAGMDWVKIDLEGVGFDMKRVLRLEGTAPSLELKSKATQLARSISGMASVVDDLKVAESDLRTLPVMTEPLVEEDLEATLTKAEATVSIDKNDTIEVLDTVPVSNKEENISSILPLPIPQVEKKSVKIPEKVVEQPMHIASVKKVTKPMRKEHTPNLTAASIKCQYLMQNVMMKKKIHFQLAKSKIKTDSYALLDRIVHIAKECDDVKIIIGGYTDAQGSAKYNRWLSQQRANAVKNYMVAAGVDKKHLKAVGYGEKNPIADNAKASGRAQNRRIEFHIQGVAK